MLNATVEIWQCDDKGVYIAQGASGGRNDPNFQGFGRFVTGSKGEYYFRTIKPVPYAGRTPHIHVKVKKGGKELLTTQIFINGYPQNKTDGVFSGVRDPLDRELVLVDFKPIKESNIGELSARFDIVVGLTPSESGEEATPVEARNRDVPCFHPNWREIRFMRDFSATPFALRARRCCCRTPPRRPGRPGRGKTPGQGEGLQQRAAGRAA